MNCPSETTLMVVEDEYLIATSLEMTLLAAGYIVLDPIPNVAEALAAVAVQHADLALLDVNLAGHRVFPVADALTSRQVPFIFLSGCDGGDLPPRFAGSPFLIKPFSAEKLLETVRQVLAGLTVGAGLKRVH